ASPKTSHCVAVRGVASALVNAAGERGVGVAGQLGYGFVGDALLQQEEAEVMAQAMEGVLREAGASADAFEDSVHIAWLTKRADLRKEHIPGHHVARVIRAVPD